MPIIWKLLSTNLYWISIVQNCNASTSHSQLLLFCEMRTTQCTTSLERRKQTYFLLKGYVLLFIPTCSVLCTSAIWSLWHHGNCSYYSWSTPQFYLGWKCDSLSPTYSSLCAHIGGERTSATSMPSTKA